MRELKGEPGTQNKYFGSLFSQAIDEGTILSIDSKLNNTSGSGELYKKQVSLTYTDKWNSKWLSNGNISIWGDNHLSNSSMIQDNFYATGQNNQEESTQMSGHNQNSFLSYEQTYTPNSNLKLRIGSFLGDYRNQETKFSNYSTQVESDGFIKKDSGSSINFSQSPSITAGTDLYFENINPRNNNRISINAYYRYSNKRQDQNSLNIMKINADSTNSISQQIYLIHTINSVKIMSKIA